MYKFVEKLNRLTSTIKAQTYYCNYKVGKTNSLQSQKGTIKGKAWPFPKSYKQSQRRH